MPGPEPFEDFLVRQVLHAQDPLAPRAGDRDQADGHYDGEREGDQSEGPAGLGVEPGERGHFEVDLVEDGCTGLVRGTGGWGGGGGVACGTDTGNGVGSDG
ncbi:hypothetical protein PG994_009638 [Apiospora phragmitis]|uniref:Uncharacterized protein n=1 Tax=Apiospora phragmitis TaxID=2905665 RepID=A0ABR1U6P2_9PEZI